MKRDCGTFNLTIQVLHVSESDPIDISKEMTDVLFQKISAPPSSVMAGLPTKIMSGRSMTSWTHTSNCTTTP